MAHFIEIKENCYINLSACLSFRIGGTTVEFVRTNKDHMRIELTDSELNAFKSNMAKLAVMNRTNSIRAGDAPSKVHIIAEYHVAQLEDIAGILFDDDDDSICIFYKKLPKYASMEVDGKYVVRIKLVDELVGAALKELNAAWAKYLDYYGS